MSLKFWVKLQNFDIKIINSANCQRLKYQKKIATRKLEFKTKTHFLCDCKTYYYIK